MGKGASLTSVPAASGQAGPASASTPGGGRRHGTVPLVTVAAETCWTTTGTREQLLAAGLCSAADFPTGRARVSRNFGERGAVRRWRLQVTRGGRWTLTQWRTHEEQQAWRARQGAAASAVTMALHAPTSATAWRERRLGHLDTLTARITATLSNADSSTNFRLSDADLRTVDALIRRLFVVVENADVVADPAAELARAARLAALHADQAADRPPAAARVPPRLVSVRAAAGANQL